MWRRAFALPEAQASSAAFNHHFGLAGIHERALMMGGELTVQSQPNRGSLLRVNVPLEAEALA